MKRCKLEYLIKTLPVEDKKEIYSIIDINGIHDFNENVCAFLRDTKTKKLSVLNVVPGAPNAEYINSFIKKYISKFSTMNHLCTKNKTNPLFPNPGDVEESEAVRADLVEQHLEEELNEFFGVRNFNEYVPEPYTCPEGPTSG